LATSDNGGKLKSFEWSESDWSFSISLTISPSKQSIYSKRKNMLIDDPRPQKIVPLIPYQQSEHIKSDSGSKPHLHRPIARAISKPEHPETPVSTISHDSSKIKKKAVLPVSSSNMKCAVKDNKN
jgi:hypothetical protein